MMQLILVCIRYGKGMIKANYADTTHFYISVDNMPAAISELQLLAFRLLKWFENNHVKATQLIFFAN